MHDHYKELKELLHEQWFTKEFYSLKQFRAKMQQSIKSLLLN